MHKDNAKDYLPLVQALAEGKAIQRVRSDGTTFGTEWVDVDDIDVNLPSSCYRIKQAQKKQSCRMFLAKSITAKTGEPLYTAIASNSNVMGMVNPESSPIFVRWLTDVIEYEIPE